MKVAAAGLGCAAAKLIDLHAFGEENTAMKYMKKFIVGIIFALGVISASIAADGKTKVACVGDSITAGGDNAYPALLARLLGSEYEVKNFGVSGRTLLRKGDHPYWNENAFANAKAMNPDIVIIKLGTNDTKPQNWQHCAEFKKDLEDMVSEFQALPSKPKIYLCTPMFVVKEVWGIRDPVVREGVIPIIREVAKEKNLPVIEIYAQFEGQSEYLPDGIHPNREGSLKMAKIIYKAITGNEAPKLN